jgi:hypothetical protein
LSSTTRTRTDLGLPVFVPRAVVALRSGLLMLRQHTAVSADELDDQTSGKPALSAFSGTVAPNRLKRNKESLPRLSFDGHDLHVSGGLEDADRYVERTMLEQEIDRSGADLQIADAH